MKKEYNKKLIVIPSKSLHRGYSPEIIPFGFRVEDEIHVTLLSCLRIFNKRINEIRQNLNITEFKELPRKINWWEVEKYLVDGLDDKKIKYLNYETIKILTDFMLHEGWDLSIKSAVLGNRLLVPPDITIRCYVPTTDITGDVKKDFTYASMSLAYIKDQNKWLKKPAIYFSGQFTPNELKSWIDKHKELINKINSYFPPKNTLAIEQHTISYGKLAWMILLDGPKTWEEIASTVCDLVDETQKDNDPECFRKKPGAEEIRKWYDRFIEHIDNISPKIKNGQ